jgi:hypothetical protein
VKRFLTFVAVVGACVGMFYLVGVILPRTTTRATRVHLLTKTNEVYRVVADVAGWPTWMPGVMSVEEGVERKGNPVWTISDSEGHTYEMEVVNASEPLLWVGKYRIEDVGHTLRFDMKWYGDGALVLLAHQRDIENRWTRARKFFGVERNISLPALTALTRKLGESSQPEEK